MSPPLFSYLPSASCPLPTVSLSQRRVFEQAEAITRLFAHVLCNHPMEIFLPGRVLIDETIRGGFVTPVLYFQNLLEQLAHDRVISVVMNPQFSIFKS